MKSTIKNSCNVISVTSSLLRRLSSVTKFFYFGPLPIKISGYAGVYFLPTGNMTGANFRFHTELLFVNVKFCKPKLQLYDCSLKIITISE